MMGLTAYAPWIEGSYLFEHLYAFFKHGPLGGPPMPPRNGRGLYDQERFAIQSCIASVQMSYSDWPTNYEGPWQVIRDWQPTDADQACQPAFRVLFQHNTVLIVIRGTHTNGDSKTTYLSEVADCHGVACHSGYLRSADFVIKYIKDQHPCLLASCMAGRVQLKLAGHSLGAAVCALMHLRLSAMGVPDVRSLGLGVAPCILSTSADTAKSKMKHHGFSLWLQDDPVPRASPKQLCLLVLRVLHAQLSEAETALSDAREAYTHDRQLQLQKIYNWERHAQSRKLKRDVDSAAKRISRLKENRLNMQATIHQAQDFVPAGEVCMLTRQGALHEMDTSNLPDLSFHTLVAKSLCPPHDIIGHAHCVGAYADWARHSQARR